MEKLEIKALGKGTQEVPGLFKARIKDTEAAWELLKHGSKARSSSPSHCLLRVTVKGESSTSKEKTSRILWLEVSAWGVLKLKVKDSEKLDLLINPFQPLEMLSLLLHQKRPTFHTGIFLSLSV